MPRWNWRAISLVVVLCAAPVVVAQTAAKVESVEALIEKGLKAYKDGKMQDAIAHLQAAIAQMQKAQQKGLAKFLPGAPEGWEAGEIDASSGATSGGGGAMAITQLTRKYTQKSGGLRVTITIMTNKDLVETQRTLAETYRKQPEIIKAMQTADNKFRLVDQDGWIGWSTVQKGSEAQTLVVSKSVMLQVQVSKDDEKALELFFKAIDLKGLAAEPTVAPTK